MKTIKKNNKVICIIDFKNKTIILNILKYKQYLNLIIKEIKTLMLHNYSLMFLSEFDINHITSIKELDYYSKELFKQYDFISTLEEKNINGLWTRFNYTPPAPNTTNIYKDFEIKANKNGLEIISPHALSFDKSLNKHVLYYTGSSIINYYYQNHFKGWKQLVKKYNATHWNYNINRYNSSKCTPIKIELSLLKESNHTGLYDHVKNLRINESDLKFLSMLHHIEEPTNPLKCHVIREVVQHAI